MDSLGQLICGGVSDGIAKVALSQLKSSITVFGGKAAKYLVEPTTDDTLSFGPFCARALLENCCAALVGRLDSFRLLYLSEFQSQPEYEHGRRARSAFAWTGDVIPDDRGPAQMWSVDNDLPKISRALLSRYCSHVYWRPAVEKAVDAVAQQPPNPYLAEIAALDAENFIDRTRGEASQLYSTLSKAVHWEFFTTALLFDEATVKSSIRDTCILVGQLGLISHFVPTAYASLPIADAFAQYTNLRETLK